MVMDETKNISFQTRLVFCLQNSSLHMLLIMNIKGGMNVHRNNATSISTSLSYSHQRSCCSLFAEWYQFNEWFYVKAHNQTMTTKHCDAMWKYENFIVKICLGYFCCGYFWVVENLCDLMLTLWRLLLD